jgi:hypothetical protein
MPEVELGLTDAADVLTRTTGRRVTEQSLRKRIQRAQRGQNGRNPAPPYRRDSEGRLWVSVDTDAQPAAAEPSNPPDHRGWRERAEAAEGRVAELERQVRRLESVVDALLGQVASG